MATARAAVVVVAGYAIEGGPFKHALFTESATERQSLISVLNPDARFDVGYAVVNP